ncbi:hypothetical protein NLI96_g1541 [Meripilus lineatus]|uniref:Uncharacterized protein n=1 Tax=Meripilus lineatus TaxID=2056292 RepID=A0AAD5VEP1_9APHY|nr:hypothetical protein NLI96_g1541 [Physisporinus lineatus]
MFNNTAEILRIAVTLDEESSSIQAGPSRPSRTKTKHNPCLPSRLPSTAFLQREADAIVPRSLKLARQRSPSPSLTGPSEPEDDEELISPLEDSHMEIDPTQKRSRKHSISSVFSTLSSATSNSLRSLSSPRSKASRPWSEPESYEVLSAIERKDIMFLMEVRDRAFHLLLQPSGGVTPLVHAMRVGGVGKTHQEVAIVILGAFSRYINHLTDEELASPKTKPILKKLRTNLKLAIDYGMQAEQRDLIASFLQTLVMSEGDQWVRSTVASVAYALRDSINGRPIETAETAIRGYAKTNLGKVKVNAALDEYIANATSDLVMMAAWSLALASVEGEPIPTYYFARDDRVYKAFSEATYKQREAIKVKVPRRLRRQLKILEEVMEGRVISTQSKVEVLARKLDEGEEL